MVIHVWLQPYKSKGLNILDSFILLSLVGFLVSALGIYWDRMIAVIFWFLPLLIFINYLAYFTYLKFLLLPCSSAAIFSTTFYFGTFANVFVILLQASSLVIFIVYIIYLLNCLCIRSTATLDTWLLMNRMLKFMKIMTMILLR